MKKYLFSFVLVCLIVTFSACAKGGSLYGEKFPQLKQTAIADILSAPDKFNGSQVLIAGEIVSECPSGGWFMLKENNAVIFVNLHPSNFAIPQAVGKSLKVWGGAGKNGPKGEVVGKGVEL